jgi:hypothetical protein
MFLAILMLSPAVSVLHTPKCELRVVSFSSSPDNYKQSAHRAVPPGGWGGVTPPKKS